MSTCPLAQTSVKTAWRSTNLTLFDAFIKDTHPISSPVKIQFSSLLFFVYILTLCYFYKLKNRNNILITESAADPLVSCYIHAVSLVKNAKSSNKKYFNCTLQKGAESVTVVCFVSQKQPELKTLDQTKAAVRVSNYNKSLTSDIVLDQPQQ